ncbi:MAG: hypothetical protein L3J33_03435 [Rhodobacteraceae bacterium]|nr:hypothetical protein [Paracoccaceae bacterium]
MSAVIDAAVGCSFVWGEHDCTLFAARCADAVWGGDIESKHRGKYKTLRGANGRISRHGGLIAGLEGEGFVEISPAFAQRGDIAIVRQDGRDALGVVFNGKIAATSLQGLVFVPVNKAQGVWRK